MCLLPFTRTKGGWPVAEGLGNDAAGRSLHHGRQACLTLQPAACGWGWKLHVATFAAACVATGEHCLVGELHCSAWSHAAPPQPPCEQAHISHITLATQPLLPLSQSPQVCAKAAAVGGQPEERDGAAGLRAAPRQRWVEHAGKDVLGFEGVQESRSCDVSGQLRSSYSANVDLLNHTHSHLSRYAADVDEEWEEGQVVTGVCYKGADGQDHVAKAHLTVSLHARMLFCQSTKRCCSTLVLLAEKIQPANLPS